MDSVKFTKIILNGKPFQKKKLDKDITLFALRQLICLSKDIDFTSEDFPICQADEANTALIEILKDETLYLASNKIEEKEIVKENNQQLVK